MLATVVKISSLIMLKCIHFSTQLLVMILLPVFAGKNVFACNDMSIYFAFPLTKLLIYLRWCSSSQKGSHKEQNKSNWKDGTSFHSFTVRLTAKLLEVQKKITHLGQHMRFRTRMHINPV